jgi:hypothetical protein
MGRKNNKNPFQDHRQRKDKSRPVPRKSLLSFLQGIHVLRIEISL